MRTPFCKFYPGDTVTVSGIFGGRSEEVLVCTWAAAKGKLVESVNGERFEDTGQQHQDHGNGLLEDRVRQGRTTLYLKRNGCVGWGATERMTLVKRAPPKAKQLLLFEEAK